MAKKLPDVSEEAARHPLEAWEPMVIHRSQINPVDYNPRHITANAAKKLERGLKKLGLISPITWNKRTGNLVGGHQRLKQLDRANKSQDYTLQVAAVDLSPEQEKAANVLLNNPEAQGEWDFEKLAEILKSPDLDLEAAGMGAADIYRIIGEQASEEVLEEVAARIEAARDIDDSVSDAREDKNSHDYYFVAVFRDQYQRAKFLETAELPQNRFVNGVDLADAMGVSLEEETA